MAPREETARQRSDCRRLRRLRCSASGLKPQHGVGRDGKKSSLDKKNVAELEEKIVRVEADDKHAAAVAVLWTLRLKWISRLPACRRRAEGTSRWRSARMPATPARSVILEQEAFAEHSNCQRPGGQPSRKSSWRRRMTLFAQLERTNACSEDVAVRRTIQRRLRCCA